MTIAIVQRAQAEQHAGGHLSAAVTADDPFTAGNQIVLILTGQNDDLTWPDGFFPIDLTDQTTGGTPPASPRVAAAIKTASGSESTELDVSWLTVAPLTILDVYEVPPSTFNGAYLFSDGNPAANDFPTVTPTGDEVLLLASISTFQGFSIIGHPSGWTLEQQIQANNGANSIVCAGYSRDIVAPAGSYGGTVDYSSSVASSAIVLIFDGLPPEECDPGAELGVYDPDDQFIGDLTDAFDIQIKKELNGTGTGVFKINRHSADAAAELLQPGNYVRVTIPQIDPNPIFGFFLEASSIALVSTDEEGGEIVTFGGRGGLAYWDRAIWLNESFLHDWVPTFIRTEHGAPPAGSLGAVHYAAGDYRRFTVSAGVVTSRTDFTTAGFSNYYDRKVRVSDGVGGTVTLIHLTTGGHPGWWVRPYGAGVTDWPKKSVYVLGPSVLLVNLATFAQPGEIVYEMFLEATAPDRPDQPIPLMSVDFGDTLDSDGNAWEVSEAASGLSSDLGEDFLSSIGKLVNTGAVDVDMDPDLGMHAYNHYGRDLTEDVRFAKALNVADELSREFSDSPVGTFAEVLGNQGGVVARVQLADAASRPAREISVRGDTDDVDALTALGLAELEARLLHSDAIGFNVATPIIGDEDPAQGLYLPGPPGSAFGDYWIGDLVTLHTGDAEHDFDEATVRVVAITMKFSESNDLIVSVEVNSAFGGFQSNGGSSGTSTSTTGGINAILADQYQLLAERDLPNGYPSLNDDALISPIEIPVVEALRTDATDPLMVLAPTGTGGLEFRAEAGGGFTPTYIGPAETFTVPANRQALYAMPIDNEGILDVVGFLIEVD